MLSTFEYCLCMCFISQMEFIVAYLICLSQNGSHFYEVALTIVYMTD